MAAGTHRNKPRSGENAGSVISERGGWIMQTLVGAAMTSPIISFFFSLFFFQCYFHARQRQGTDTGQYQAQGLRAMAHSETAPEPRRVKPRFEEA